MKRLLFCILLLTSTWISSYSQSGYLYSSSLLSSNQVTCLAQDKDGYLWVGTDHGLNKFDGYHFKSYYCTPGNSSSLLSNAISTLFVDKGGCLWVGTSKGLMAYDKKRDCFINYQKTGSSPRISCIVQTGDESILAGTAGYGLYKVVEKNQTLDSLTNCVPKDAPYYINRIYLDENGNIWKSGADSTIYKYDIAKQTFIKIHSPYGIPTALIKYREGMLVVCQRGLALYSNGYMDTRYFDLGDSHIDGANLRCAVTDDRGNLYIGSLGKGLFKVESGSRRIERVKSPIPSFDLASANVFALFVDKDNNLWTGCPGMGVFMIPEQSNIFNYWSLSSQQYNISSSITSACLGDNGHIWCSVQNNGIFEFSSEGKIVSHPETPPNTCFIYRDREGTFWTGSISGLFKFSPEKNSFQHCVSFYSNYINAMADDEKRVYFSAFGHGLGVYNKKDGSFVNFRTSVGHNSDGVLCNDWIQTIFIDSKGILWLGTSSGLCTYDPESNNFKPLGWNRQLGGIICYSFAETSKGDMLIGTEMGLYVYRKASKKVEPFETDNDDMKNLMIRSMKLLGNGDLWCSTSKGLWQYQAATKEFIGYIHGNGLVESEYIKNVAIQDNDKLYFATSQGVTMFSPSQLENAHWNLGEVHLTSFLIEGIPVNCETLSGGKKIIDCEVSDCSRFNLSYQDNNFTMLFSLLHFTNNENIKYQYRINGSDKWIETDAGVNHINFSHLKPGRYIIEVRATDIGLVSPVREFCVIISPPWYNSPVAYLLYMLIFAAVVALVIFQYIRKRRQKLYEEKMEFLINATHDIRSPITLIKGPLRKLMKNSTIVAEGGEELNTIEHNTNRVLNLVNQILDLRKIDKQQLVLKYQKTDLVSFIGVIYKMYEFNAKERNIKFTYKSELEHLYVWIDRNNFDKVISNLLSNAFKFSFDGGEIIIEVTRGHDNDGKDGLNDYAQINVIDSGIGLKPAQIRHIFDRFYQGGAAGSMHIDGSGIGLNLCKTIVEMHHGSITAHNRQTEAGSVFTVKIPVGKEHLDNKDIEVEDTMPKQTRKSYTGYKVLIVDDDKEICQYICNELGAYYQFGTSSNGKEAIKELLNNSYDIVVADVMMPEMDGFTMLRLIKSNTNISHIPVIILTSKSDVENRLEGLERGADGFLAKPFDIEELHMMINNLINNMRRLRGKFSGAQQQKDKIIEKTVKGNDEQLMERIMKVVNDNFSNSDLNVDMITREVGISRAQLHRKMKEMTGIPTSEFIRNLRLERAAKLLVEDKLNVTQVAYDVGFSNLSHFSALFRKHFGCTPSEYVEKNSRKKESL